MPQRTPLYKEHLALAGRMVEFAGWELPVQYQGIIREHLAVRRSAGVFDVSHMGEIAVRGRDALRLIEYATTRRVADLKTGRMRYGLLCNEDGGIMDDLTVYRFAPDDFLLVVNAGPRNEDLKRLQSCRDERGMDAEVLDLTGETGKIDIQGPLAVDIACSVFGKWPGKLKRFGFRRVDDLTVSRSGYTGEDGLEIYLPWDKTVERWRALLDARRDDGVVPCGLGARDTLRLEACLVLSGTDVGPDFNPFEAGLGWAVDLDKETFVGKVALEQAEGATKRRLVPFVVDSRRAARHGDAILLGGREVGVVTSGAYSPALERAVGMGYIETAGSQPGTPVSFKVRGKEVKGTVGERPLVAHGRVEKPQLREEGYHSG